MSPGNARTEVLQLLGLAHRAGVVSPGTSAVRESVKRGSARLVLTATDASETQLEKVRGLLRHRGVPECRVGSRDELGGAVGRGPLSALAVEQDGFAGRIRELLDS